MDGIGKIKNFISEDVSNIGPFVSSLFFIFILIAIAVIFKLHNFNKPIKAKFSNIDKLKHEFGTVIEVEISVYNKKEVY